MSAPEKITGSSAKPRIAVGQTLGDYVLLAKLGAGGMGEVYKAEHQRMKRVVALKVLSPRITSNPEAIKRFEREVETAARLMHPNIVAALDARQDQGVHFLVMEYVEGSDLWTLVRKKGPLLVEQAVHCILQAAKGLEHAHSKGIVHRDIKPANLLLDHTGTVKVLDMGLARIEQPSGQKSEALTATMQILGTYDYMAPEQALDTRHADARCDVYSLGCTLYYLLTGNKLYDAESTPQKLLAHRNAPIPSLVKQRDDVPWVLDQLFQKMVAKQPGDRFQTMAEVCQALVGCLPRGHGQTGDASQLSAAALSNSELMAFLRNVASDQATTGDETGARGHDSDTEAYQGTGASGTRLRPAAGRSSMSVDHRRQPPVAWVIGSAALLLAIGGLGWYFASGSSETAKKLPATVATRPVTSPAAKDPPPIARVPFIAQEAIRHQKRWADYLGTPPVITNKWGMKLALVPPGEFVMGTPQAEIDKLVKSTTSGDAKRYFQSEGPQHAVKVTHPYFLGVTEVTLGQFRRFVEATGYKTEVESDPKGGSGRDQGVQVRKLEYNWRNVGYPINDDYPVGNVSWNDAVAFCNFLSQQDGLTPCFEKGSPAGWKLVTGTGYRLPTEAEWEFACRAGTTTAYSMDDSFVGTQVRASVSSLGTTKVASYITNAFGLYDMHGNIEEWCLDWWAPQYPTAIASDPIGSPTGTDRAVRGGNYGGIGVVLCRSAGRRHFPPNRGNDGLGFRVLRSVPRKDER